MSVDLSDPVVEALVTARVKMLLKQPFFGNIGMRLKLVDASKWCPTAATDGRFFYYNRDFISRLTKDEIVFLFGHELLHAVYDHIGRRGSRDPKVWNMAVDYIVNYTLVKNNVGQMIKNGLINEKYTDAMTSEEVYKLLMDDAVTIEMPMDMHLDKDDGDEEEDGDGKGKKKSNGDGNGEGGKITATVLGEDGPPKLTEEDLAQIREEMKNALVSAVHSVGAGNVPAGVRRLIEDLTEPKIDWREMIDTHIKSAIKEDFTFNKPARRTWSVSQLVGRRMIFPGQADAETIDIFCAIDTSGSMTDKMLRDFLSEVRGIMQEFSDFKLQLCTFDTQIYNHVVFTPDTLDDILDYDVKGGGGTMFEAVFDMIREMDEAPQKLIMFTDGFPNSTWGDPDLIDTLFVIHSNPGCVPPFGIGVDYD